MSPRAQHLADQLFEAKQKIEAMNDPMDPANDPSHPRHHQAIRERLEARRLIEQFEPGWCPSWHPLNPENESPTFSELREPPDPGSVVALRRMKREQDEEAKREKEASRFRDKLLGRPVAEEEAGRES